MMIGKYEVAGRLVALVVGGLVLLAAISFGLSQCQKRRSEAAQSRVEHSQGEAATNSAADAIGTVTASGARETASEDLTRTNERDIRSAEGADQRINPAAQVAGLKALCRREAYRNSERCKIFLKESTR